MYYCCVCPKCSKHVTLQSHESALGCILRMYPECDIRECKSCTDWNHFFFWYKLANSLSYFILPPPSKSWIYLHRWWPLPSCTEHLLFYDKNYSTYVQLRGCTLMNYTTTQHFFMDCTYIYHSTHQGCPGTPPAQAPFQSPMLK